MVFMLPQLLSDWLIVFTQKDTVLASVQIYIYIYIYLVYIAKQVFITSIGYQKIL